MLYEKYFSKLEKVRWSLENDIDWEAINPNLISIEQKELIRNICMTELGSLFALEAFLRDFYDDIDFSCFLSVWYYEEMKHFLVLKRYLSYLDITISETELQYLRMSIPQSNQENILMIHFLSEHRLGSWYQEISNWLEEPVGKEIFKFIAIDEFRHGQSYFDFIQKDLVHRPERLLKYMRTALFMLNPKAPIDIHAVTLTKTTDRLNDPDYIVFIEDSLVSPEKKQVRLGRLYSLLSLLAGQNISDYGRLFQLVKELKKRA